MANANLKSVPAAAAKEAKLSLRTKYVGDTDKLSVFLRTETPKDGKPATFTVFAIVESVNNGKKERSKGAISVHADPTAARKAFDVLCADAVAGGWKIKSENIRSSFTVIPKAK